MKNFEARYTVVGTSALKVDASKNQAHAAIIEFPASGKTGRPRHAASRHLHGRVSDLELVSELRTGTARGKAFGRIAPWQSVSAGVVLAAAAFATIFLGI